MIALEKATIAVGARMLLADVNVSIRAGEFVGVLGANGVGKTTLLRTIAGLHAAREGAVAFDGTDVARLTPAERARHCAFVTSDDALTDALTVHDVVAIGRYPHHRWWQWNSTERDDAAVDEALAETHMSDYRERLFTTLSSGERQRVWIAMGLAQDAPVLLLDEPTSHLDIRAAHEILALLRNLARGGKTIVCALHDLNDAAAYADRVMVLAQQRVLALGAPEDVLLPTVLERAFGVAMETTRTSSGVRIFPVTR